MSKVPHIPKGYNSVTPYLVVKGASQAIEYYKKVFGATEVFRMDQPDGKVGHPRLKGYMKTDAEGRFELHTIVPGRYPGMRIPAHIHFNLWGAGYPVQWVDDLRFEDDSYLTEAMRMESRARGTFATIRP